MDIVESTPHNYSHKGKHQGVGGHLFANAYQISMEAGCDGYVAFTAKSDLMAYYSRVLNAQVARGGQRMFLDEVAAEILLDKYIRK